MYQGRQHCLACGPKDGPDGPTWRIAVRKFSELMHLSEADRATAKNYVPEEHAIIYPMLKRLRTRLGLEGRMIPYSYRHTFATRWLLPRDGWPGGSRKVLAEMLGTSVDMLEKHYGHLDAGRAALRNVLDRPSARPTAGKTFQACDPLVYELQLPRGGSLSSFLAAWPPKPLLFIDFLQHTPLARDLVGGRHRTCDNPLPTHIGPGTGVSP